MLQRWTRERSSGKSAQRLSAASPNITKVADQRVYRKGDGQGLSLAEAAEWRSNWGYRQDCAPNLYKLTKASIAALAGQGLVAAAKDTYPRDGITFPYIASFAEVEVDAETGKYKVG
jgi:CO/xanthine dehydrogenase Mo-binding subunit